MAEEFRMPDLGEGLTEAEIVSWSVEVGDHVELNQVIAEVESAKALVELPSPYAGVVEALLVDAATTVPVGTPIVRIRTDDAPMSTDDELPPAEENQVLVGYGPGAEPESKRRRARETTRPDSPSTPRPDATPAARRLARERGIDLSTVSGSGPDGAVTVGDLDIADAVGDLDTADAAGDLDIAQDSESRRIPVRGVRKQMAAAMVDSAFTAPHATVFVTVDVTRSMELLGRLRSRPEFDGLPLTPLTLVAKATVAAVRGLPEINASWDGDSIVVHRSVNLGIAAATSRGLVVPNVKDAQALTLAELCRAIGELTETARSGKATPSDLSGGTISITNVGPFGVDAGTPILNPGEAAILCLGRVAKRPWVYEDDLMVRDVATLSLTFDHRVIDGEQASTFLSQVGAMLADPAALIAHL
ncbi:MAG: 2-oxo acid dehydrogenase subunit E2 [Rhodococcus sp.]|nr:2-oxo acid dehydrogenase subunit E2 [Rhodococcus sp. (in: high G+C Gram-positive bacteria)]